MAEEKSNLSVIVKLEERIKTHEQFIIELRTEFKKIEEHLKIVQNKDIQEKHDKLKTDVNNIEIDLLKLKRELEKARFGQFSEQRFPHVNFKEFNPNVFSEEYHYWEKFDDKKEYKKGDFFHDYGKGLMQYTYILYRIVDRVNPVIKANYVVAKTVLTEKEANELAPFCPCAYCSIPWYFCCCKMFLFGGSTGCIAGGHYFALQRHIDEAKRRLKEHGKKNV
jgi:hypothetical protein